MSNLSEEPKLAAPSSEELDWTDPVNRDSSLGDVQAIWLPVGGTILDLTGFNDPPIQNDAPEFQHSAEVGGHFDYDGNSGGGDDHFDTGRTTTDTQFSFSIWTLDRGGDSSNNHMIAKRDATSNPGVWRLNWSSGDAEYEFGINFTGGASSLEN